MISHQDISAKKLSFEDTAIAFEAKSNFQLKKMYWLFSSMNNNFLVNVGTTLLKFAFKAHLPVKWAVKRTVFEHFCGGESIQECEKAVEALGKFGIGAILDYSVEGEKSEKSFDATMQETILTIQKAAKSSHIPFSVFKVTGVAPFAILEKVQSKQPLTPAEEILWQNAKNRVNLICEQAYKHQVKVLIDGEETWVQDTLDELAYQMMGKYNRETCIVYNTYQMYRWDMLENLKNAFEAAEQKGYFLGAKLVRGAYMEKERARAEKMNYKCQIQPDKEACDRDFNLATTFCVENIQKIGLVCGTHNQNSNQILADLMEKHQIAPDDTRIYFAQLYGMSDNISYALSKAGYNVVKYLPYGPVEAVMPYLFRRADENTSVKGQSSREFLLIESEIRRRKNTKK